VFSNLNKTSNKLDCLAKDGGGASQEKENKGGILTYYQCIFKHRLSKEILSFH